MKENGIKFGNWRHMYGFIVGGKDLYNPKLNKYVFCYNNDGALCVYDINEEQASELIKKSKDGLKFWFAYLGPGGSILDDDSKDRFAEKNEYLKPSYEFCREYFDKDGWCCADTYSRLNRETKVTITGTRVFSLDGLSGKNEAIVLENHGPIVEKFREYHGDIKAVEISDMKIDEMYSGRDYQSVLIKAITDYYGDDTAILASYVIIDFDKHDKQKIDMADLYLRKMYDSYGFSNRCEYYPGDNNTLGCAFIYNNKAGVKCMKTLDRLLCVDHSDDDKGIINNIFELVDSDTKAEQIDIDDLIDKQTVRQWIEHFNNGYYSSPSLESQINAGWGDWRVPVEELYTHTNCIGNIIRNIKNDYILDNYFIYLSNIPLDADRESFDTIDGIGFTPIAEVGDADDEFFYVVIRYLGKGKRKLYSLINSALVPIYEFTRKEDLIKAIDELGNKFKGGTI